MVAWGQGLQGAAGGFSAGAATGNPWAAGVGAVLGGVGGLFGGEDPKEKYRKQLSQLASGYGKRTAPQAGAAALAGNSQFRGNQAGLISQLEAMARGEGPSAASIQMRDAMDRAAGAQASAAAGAGGRGVNQGAALRGAMNNTAAVQAQGARDTATMRAQEQLNSIGQLGQNIAQGRSADEATSQFNAGAQNSMSAANLESALRTMGLNQQGELQALQLAMGASGPGIGAQIGAFGAGMAPGIASMMQSRQQASQGQQGYGSNWGGNGALGGRPGGFGVSNSGTPWWG